MSCITLHTSHSYRNNILTVLESLFFKNLFFKKLSLSYSTAKLIEGCLLQKPRESEGLGRQDSSGHLTLNLLPSSTTQLLAATQTAMPRPAAGGALKPSYTSHVFGNGLAIPEQQAGHFISYCAESEASRRAALHFVKGCPCM